MGNPEGKVVENAADPVITGTESTWRYEVAPRGDAKVQLLTIGFVAVNGHWRGKYGELFIAWAPMPRRDKKREAELGLIIPTRRIEE